jgi:hypothetical protein
MHNSISKILPLIVNNDYGLIIINSEVKNKDFSKLINKSILPYSKTNIVYKKENFLEFFVNTISYLSFIGCVIIERKIWINREKEKYFNTEFIHVGVIFQEIIEKDILVITEPMITIRLGNEQWSSRSFEIWIFKWPRLINSFEYIPESYRSLFSEKPNLRRFRNVFIQRTKDAYNFKLYKQWFHKEKFPLYWKFILLVLSITPIIIGKMILFVYLKFNNEK